LMTAIRFAFVALVTVPPSRGRFNRSGRKPRPTGAF
jgi:hypothetical protein